MGAALARRVAAQPPRRPERSDPSGVRGGGRGPALARAEPDAARPPHAILVMTRQNAQTAGALWRRIQPVFDDTPRTTQVETAAGQAGWPAGFGADISDVKSIVIHTTDGWPTRDKSGEFVRQYTVVTASKRGIGPHVYMPYDGTVFRILSENRQCWHANHVNGWAIGVETGNLTRTAHPNGAGGPWPRRWTQLSTDAEDIPGAKLY